MMDYVVYEFDSVTDRDGKSKIEIEHHANPVIIYSLMIGRSASLVYFDRPSKGIKTSIVEDILIFENSIKITTKNSIYYLKPYVRRGN